MENDAVVEITSGFIGFRKTAILLIKDSKCHIWIEDKRLFNCTLLKAPFGYAYPAKKVFIYDILGDGSIIKMMDGSIYEVDSLDTIYTSLWIGFSNGILLNNTELLNLDEGEMVHVNKLR